jgi:hypothetical protein
MFDTRDIQENYHDTMKQLRYQAFHGGVRKLQPKTLTPAPNQTTRQQEIQREN